MQAELLTISQSTITLRSSVNQTGGRPILRLFLYLLILIKLFHTINVNIGGFNTEWHYQSMKHWVVHRCYIQSTYNKLTIYK